MAGAGKGGGFGEAVAAWIRASMRDPRTGRDKMNRTDLIRTAKIARATLYRLLSGDAADVDQATIDALAKALKVPAPRIERTLRGAGVPAEYPAPTPLGLLRETRALIAQVERMLDRDDPPDPRLTDEAGRAADRARVLARDAAPGSGATRGHSRRAVGH